jgi:hypothetical protein
VSPLSRFFQDSTTVFEKYWNLVNFLRLTCHFIAKAFPEIWLEPIDVRIQVRLGTVYSSSSSSSSSSSNNNNNNNNNNKYVKRHDKVSAQIHFNICKEIGVQLEKNTGMNMYHTHQ